MSVPRPILELIELIDDLAQGRAALRTGPVRFEAPLDLVIDAPVDSDLDRLLAKAWFLAPKCAGLPTPSEWDGLVALAARVPELHLDLALPEIPSADEIPTPLRPRLARLTVPVGGADTGSLVRAAEPVADAIAGRLVLDLATPVGASSSIEPLLAVIADARTPKDLALRPADRDARQELNDAWPAIRQAAERHRVNVRVRGGPRADVGAPLDSMAGPHVLDTCLRATFRTRSSLCPFPFLSLAIRDDGEVAVCPALEGPSTSDAADATTWNGPLFTSVRQGFLDGTPPDACASCTLLPRVRRSLAERPWEDADDDGAHELPAGALEV